MASAWISVNQLHDGYHITVTSVTYIMVMVTGKIQTCLTIGGWAHQHYNGLAVTFEPCTLCKAIVRPRTDCLEWGVGWVNRASI